MQPTQRINRKPALEASLELAVRRWKVALGGANRANPTVFSVDAADLWERLQQLLQRLAEFKARWGLPGDCQVALIYEAGQEGFWIARALEAAGVQVIVVDPASVPVARHARRAKTDRLDALKLLEVLRGWLRGECGELRVLHIPTQAEEAQRLLSRERGLLQKEGNQHVDRMVKRLRLYGCSEPVDAQFVQKLQAGQIRQADGSALPQQLCDWLMRECERLELVRRQLRQLEKTLVQHLPAQVQGRIDSLQRLRAVGPVGAMRLVLELFWRDFGNRRQVGACVGLVPQPYDSGDSHVDQGISKQGNRRVRSLLIEMAWFWVRYQPASAISQWFARRTSGAGKRSRRIAIVAVARRLAIGLWRYLRDGVVPAGAQFKPA